MKMLHIDDEVGQAAMPKRASRWLDWHDLSLVEANLARSPAERLARAQRFAQTAARLRRARTAS